MRDMTWAEVGGDAVVISSGGWGFGHVITTSTITKVGKRDITLATGRRYRVTDGTEQGGSVGYANRIVSPTDKRIAQIKNAEVRQAAKNAANSAVDHWKSSKDDTERLVAAIAALTALLDAPEAE